MYFCFVFVWAKVAATEMCYSVLTSQILPRLVRSGSFELYLMGAQARSFLAERWGGRRFDACIDSKDMPMTTPNRRRAQSTADSEADSHVCVALPLLLACLSACFVVRSVVTLRMFQMKYVTAAEFVFPNHKTLGALVQQLQTLGADNHGVFCSP